MSKTYKFPLPSLYFVTDSTLTKGRELLWVVKEVLKGGCDIIQYREKNFQYYTHLSEVEAIHKACKEYGKIFLINDRVDLCLVLDADGVHLGKKDMPILHARKLLGKNKIIGLSIDTEDDLFYFLGNPSLKEAVDYIALSPIFSTNTKTDTAPPWGMDGLKKHRKSISHPIAAIGGINLENLKQIVVSGADLIAVVSALASAPNPQETTLQMKEIILKAYINQTKSLQT